MNPAPLDPPRVEQLIHPDELPWSAGRWLSWLIAILGAHIGLFYILGNRNPPTPRPVKNASAMTLRQTPTESQQLDDPTWFALPHPRGFAAETWLRLPQVAFAPFRWTEPPRLLPLPIDELGTLFLKQTETNSPTRRELELTAPALTSVVSPSDFDNQRKVSAVRIKGIPAERKLRHPIPALPVFSAREALTNTVIKFLVDARGQVLSPTVFYSGSGSKEADQTALQTAYQLWFNSVSKTTPLASGWLIFEWATTLATNGPATIP